MVNNVTERTKLIEKDHNVVLKITDGPISKIPLPSNKNNLEISTHLLFAAKHIERIGDHVTNICENVYFLITGDQIKGTRSKGDKSES